MKKINVLFAAALIIAFARVDAHAFSIPSDDSGKGFFIQIGGGIGSFLKSPSTFNRTFSLYGEEGTSREEYKMKPNTSSALSLGTFVSIGDIPVKIGISAEYWNFKSEGAFSFSLPHPSLPNSPRTVTLAKDSRSFFTSLAAFGLFRVMGNNRLTLYAGPEVGGAFGKFRMLDDIDIEDQSPYTASDVTITSASYVRPFVSGLRAGFSAELEYALSKKISLTLDLKAFFMSPKVEAFTEKINLSQAEALLGLQYNF
jgi:hypothetical protein